MSKFFKYFSILLAVLVQFNAAFAQVEDKYEREIRINKIEFPEPALKLLSPLMEQDKRRRFYKEVNKKSYSYEYKSNYNKEKVSIKFNQQGELQDIEVKKEFNSLPEEIQTKIKQYFDKNFEKYKFKKTQIQYTAPEGSGEKLSKHFNSFLKDEMGIFTIKYEIETEVINPKKERGYFEYLFSAKAEVEKVKKIIERADDNILY